MDVDSICNLVVPDCFLVDIASRLPRVVLRAVALPSHKVLSAGRVSSVTTQTFYFKLVTPLTFSCVDPDAEDKFKLDDFYETVSPIVYSVTGAPDECSDDEKLPGKYMVMAEDTMKKRWQYLQKKGKKNKRANNNDQKSHQPPNKRQRGKKRSK